MEIIINDKGYILGYTRDSIIKAEKAFDTSLMRNTEPKSYTELDLMLKTLLYGALINAQPKIKIDDMNDLYDLFIGDTGFEQEALITGLMEMLEKAVSPTGGNRRKKFGTKAKK